MLELTTARGSNQTGEKGSKNTLQYSTICQADRIYKAPSTMRSNVQLSHVKIYHLFPALPFTKV